MKLTKKSTDKVSDSNTKSLSTSSSTVSDNISGRVATLTTRWDSIASKDKLALTVLCIFLLGFFGMYGGYLLNTKVTKQQRIFDTRVNDFFWLRSQANNLKPSSTINATDAKKQPLHIQLSNTIRSMGVNNPTVMQSGDNIQLSFEHKSQATISRALEGLQMKIAPQGYKFSRLQISQNEQATLIKVQATVSSNSAKTSPQ